MRIVGNAFLILLAALVQTLPAQAQSVPLLQSAETIEPRNFKLLIAPAYAFGKNGASDEVAIAGHAGYGFTERFDAELKAAFFESATVVGGDAEAWLLRDVGLNFSLQGGLHWVFGGDDRFDTMGLELTPIASIPLREGFDLYGGFNAAFEKIRDAPAGVDDTFTRTHFVPGIEYKLSEDADLAAEFGIGLNDDSWSYFATGIEFYLRPDR